MSQGASPSGLEAKAPKFSNPGFTGQCRSPYCLVLRTILLLVQCLAMQRRSTWEQRRVMERPSRQHACSQGSDHPPCASTLLETFCCPSTKLTYSCLSNFETSIYLLKQKEFLRLHQWSFILMIFLGFDFVKKKFRGWSQLSWEAESVRSRIRTLRTGSCLQLPNCMTVSKLFNFSCSVYSV